MFRRILIANRGEIALRVIRTAREMGVECVAVHSDADRKALHVRMAHRAVSLGGETPAESYLRQEAIIEAALSSGAEAIHPGYGFLSENAAFARRVEEAGLVWIGPPADAIHAMGDKIESRRAMVAAGVPCVPGLTDPVDDVAAAAEAAEDIGYPIAIKAAAGGGGKGIRVVRDPADMESAFRAASGEAVTSFGDGRVYLERYLDEPRHVEIQVMFDAHGNGVHLFERECSIQRNHQKLIEESPSPALDAETRARVGAQAAEAARTLGYCGAGTVEFLLDPATGTLHFMEMNTRLQVEHPITEETTGVDVVAEQLRVAAGARLSLRQEDVAAKGHAVECRINAEDPADGFRPTPGLVTAFEFPADVGPGRVRVDSHVAAGDRVSPHYDSLLAKVITWGATRDEALDTMAACLQGASVEGVATTIPLHLAVLDSPAFRSGTYSTAEIPGWPPVTDAAS